MKNASSDNTYRARLYFEDECPRIGCGWRDVIVKEGERWAYLTEIATRKRVKVKVDLLDRLESLAEGLAERLAA